jgi:hypothetical protein
MAGMVSPKGSLPDSVYWKRRAAFGTLILFCVLGVSSLIRGLSDAEDDPIKTSGSTKTEEVPESKPSPKARKSGKTKRRNEPTKSAKPAPEGLCSARDINATPIVRQAVAGQDVVVVVQLQNQVTLACTWDLSPRTFTMKITSGEDTIWSSQDCPGAITKQTLVLRRDFIVRTAIAWSPRRSGDACTRGEDWVLPGAYHVAVAALGGEPTDVQFELAKPESTVVTSTISPGPSQDPTSSTKPSR